jgi:hypothetical protein
MKVLIVDFDHYEMLYSLYMSACRYASHIYICSVQEYIERLKELELPFNIKVDWIVADSPKDLLAKAYKFSGVEVQYSFLNTIYSDFNDAITWLSMFSYGHIVLTIHNANFWLMKGTRYKLFKRPRNEQHKAMLRLVELSASVLVLSENVKKYIESKYKPKKNIVVFPYSVYEGFRGNTTGDCITIAVPGVIERTRRDYELVLNVFQELDSKKFKLKLLGPPIGDYGNEIVAKCLELKKKGYLIDLLEDPKHFEHEISDATVILAPINIHTSFAGIEETYGVSKESGVIFDVVRYAMPAILPKSLHVPADISNAILRYNTADELKVQIVSLTEHSTLEKLKEKAVTVSQNYSIDAVSKKLFEDLGYLS